MTTASATVIHWWLGRTRRALALAAAITVVCALVPLPVLGQEVPELQITSTNYIVIDADTGEIYAQRGAHEHRAPASLTKIFTAIESIESAPPDAQVVTSESDLVSEMASQIGFAAGEVFTVEELLYGMMLPSGNDAARALARGLGAREGDTDEQALDRFLERINQRVRRMGLTDTQLLNPDGWGIPGHYSSPYDLAAFTMYAIRYPRFVQTFSTLTYETNDGQWEFRNNNRMLRTYDGIIGGKTGYDDDAGWCLINVAQRGGHKAIAVTMNGVAPDDWYDDNRVLLDYAFEQMALRDESGAGVAGEILRYRDPDAAVILAMASAGSAIGAPLFAAPPVAPLLAGESAPELVPQTVALSHTGASSAGLLAAASVAAALIVLQALSRWRVLSRQRRSVALSDAASAPPLASVREALP